MADSLPFPTEPPGVRLPYQQATAAQQTQAVAYLRQRLMHHFPALRASAWPLALADYQPDLWLVGQEIVLAQPELTQLVQHLASAPELPFLDPPIYGLPTLHLAQYCLRASDLAAWVLPELVAAATCGPRLYTLLSHLAQPSPLAEQVVHAWCWNLPSAPPLPLGLPGRRVTPGSSEVKQWLLRLRQLSESSTTPLTPDPASAAGLAQEPALASEKFPVVVTRQANGNALS